MGCCGAVAGADASLALAVSNSSGPKLSTADVAACERRSNARKRASSSGSSKGLIM